MSAKFLSVESPIFVILLLSLTTVLFSYPIFLHLSTHLVCTDVDAWQFVWNYFSFRERILHGQDPYYTDYLFYPLGTSLLLHANAEFNSVASLPLSFFLNDVALTNLMGMLSTVLTALGVYVLARDLTHNGTASLFAALAFAFTPFRMNRMTYQMHLSLTQWIPFALWSFLRMAEFPGKRYALLTGLFFALTWYCNPYYSAYLLIAFLLILGFGLLRSPQWRTLPVAKSLLLSGAFALLLLFPVGLRLYEDYQEKTIYPYFRVSRLAAGIHHYFERGPMNRVLNEFLGQQHLNDLLGTITERGLYKDVTPGWTVLTVGLVGIALALRRRQRRLNAISLVGLAFFLLSLGSSVSIGSLQVPMPYLLITKVPYLDHVRTPERCAIMASLALSLGAGYCVSLLLQQTARPRRSVGLAALFTILLVELAPVPVPMQPFDPPEIFKELGQGGGGTLLTLPFLAGDTPEASYYLAYQAMHRHKVMDGRIARKPHFQLSFLKNLPVTETFNTLSRKGKLPWKAEHRDHADAPLFRRFFNVTHLALFPPYSDQQEVLKYIDEVFPDAQLLADQKEIKVYRLPRVEKQTFQLEKLGRGLEFFLLSNWRVSNARGRKRLQWVGKEAELLIPHVEPQDQMSLRMQIKWRGGKTSSFPELTLSVDEQPLKKIRLRAKRQTIQAKVPGGLLQEGHQILKMQLASEGQPERMAVELLSLRLSVLSSKPLPVSAKK